MFKYFWLFCGESLKFHTLCSRAFEECSNIDQLIRKLPQPNSHFKLAEQDPDEQLLRAHIVWKFLKMSHLKFLNFDIFRQFLLYQNWPVS